MNAMKTHEESLSGQFGFHVILCTVAHETNILPDVLDQGSTRSVF